MFKPKGSSARRRCVGGGGRMHGSVGHDSVGEYLRMAPCAPKVMTVVVVVVVIVMMVMTRARKMTL